MIPLGILGSATPRAGGGGPPPPTGAPPTDYANLAFWYDGDNSAHYQGSTTSTSAAVADGDPVARFDSVAAINRVVAGYSSLGQIGTLKVPGGGEPRHVNYEWTVATSPGVYTKPSAGANPATYQTLNSLIANSAGTVIALVRVNASPVETTNYDNTLIFCDPDRYLGLSFYRVGTTVYFMALNYDGNYDELKGTAGTQLGEWAVVTWIHRSGQLRLRINGSEIDATASGNTLSVAGAAILGAYQLYSGADVDIAQQCVFRAGRTDAEILEVERFFGAKAGLSF